VQPRRFATFDAQHKPRWVRRGSAECWRANGKRKRVSAKALKVTVRELLE
jgi:hypothetical protein